MFRTIFASVGLILGCGLIALGGNQREAQAMSASGLATYTGGSPKWCQEILFDAAGTDCDECVAIPGGSTHCFNTNRDEKQEYLIGQSPALEVDLEVRNCGGWGQNYTSANCTTGPMYQPPGGVCVRQYDYNVVKSVSMGVNCVAP